MKRKRFVKKMMGLGYSRNHANAVADLIPAARTHFPCGSPAPSYAVTLRGFRQLQVQRGIDL